ncbi:MAG: mercuric transporter MerT family protein [Acidobacteriaceae bacterium]
MSNAAKTGTGTLAAGGIAALAASSCCLGPLLLVALGFSGTWIGNLGRMEPYRPWFLGLAVVCLALAAGKIFAPSRRTNVASDGQCETGECCAGSQTRKFQIALFVSVALLVVIAFAFPYFARFFY